MNMINLLINDSDSSKSRVEISVSGVLLTPHEVKLIWDIILQFFFIFSTSYGKMW